MPSSFMDIRKRIADERTVLICLAVGFVASFLAMVSSSYSASRIGCSASLTGDVNVQSAYRWSWVSAVFEAVLMVGTAGGIIYLILRKPN